MVVIAPDCEHIALAIFKYACTVCDPDTHLQKCLPVYVVKKISFSASGQCEVSQARICFFLAPAFFLLTLTLTLLYFGHFTWPFSLSLSLSLSFQHWTGQNLCEAIDQKQSISNSYGHNGQGHLVLVDTCCEDYRCREATFYTIETRKFYCYLSSQPFGKEHTFVWSFLFGLFYLLCQLTLFHFVSLLFLFSRKQEDVK